MASNIDHEAIRLAPAEQPPPAEYWGDFYSWLMEQAAHVRAGRWEALDRENLAEEIESLGREQFNKLETAPRVLMMHMLKWDHQPNLRSRSWVLSIEASRTGQCLVRQPRSQTSDSRGDCTGLSARLRRSRERDRIGEERIRRGVSLYLE
jgi:hypothetical protein